MTDGDDDEQGRTEIHRRPLRPNPGGGRRPLAPDQTGATPVFGGRSPEEVRRSVGLGRPTSKASPAPFGSAPFGSDVPRASQARGPRAGSPAARPHAASDTAATAFMKTVTVGEDTSLADAAAPA